MHQKSIKYYTWGSFSLSLVRFILLISQRNHASAAASGCNISCRDALLLLLLLHIQWRPLLHRGWLQLRRWRLRQLCLHHLRCRLLLPLPLRRGWCGYSHTHSKSDHVIHNVGPVRPLQLSNGGHLGAAPGEQGRRGTLWHRHAFARHV